MTNGEKIKEIFPNANIKYNKATELVDEHVTVLIDDCDTCQDYSLYWWNAEYKEPTTKNDLAVEEHKGEVMDFPNTFDEFAKDYGFKDKEEVYTNGSELIQVYRVKQWLEHINETTTMIDKSNFSQEQYKADLQSAYDCGYNQACKDKITMPYATPDNCGNYIEQTTMNDLGVDCISRQAVIDGIKEYFHDEYYQRTSIQDCRDCFIEDVLNHLPSVTPQPRKGHWIDEGIYADGQSYHSYMCSECGWHHIEHKNELVDFKYCPFCRADMREAKE